MKKYAALRSMMVYVQNVASLPRGDKPGYGNCVFLASPSKEDGYSVLSDSFLAYSKGLYKHYMIDFIYKEKLGYKKYVVNNTGTFKKEFTGLEFPSQMTLITNGNRASILKQKRNLIVNLGEWLRLFFLNQIKSSNEKICNNFFTFIGKHLNDDIFNIEGNNHVTEYKKILYIDMDQWLTETNKLSLDRKSLTNPISILLVSLYKFPEVLANINGIDILLVSRSQSKIMRMDSHDLTKKNYAKIKQKILSMVRNIVIDEANMDESVVLDGKVPENKPIDQMTSNEIILKMKAKDEEKENKIRTEIINNLTKNLIGDYDDITGEDEDETVETDDDKVNEIKNLANNYIDEHPELLENEDTTVSTKEVTREVKRRYYVKEFTPKHTDAQLKEMQKLANQQIETIGNLEAEITDMKSKVIDESEYTNVVKTTNPNVMKSKFVNFDKSYNEKKLQKDIDNSVGMLANASTKVYIVDKKEEDTSTPLDLKKTMTYKLRDENGNDMTLKFDVPIIYDDHFMMIKGNKKIIQHTLILKPLVKTGKDTVQIVSNYQKMFIMRKGSIDLKTNALLRYLLANKNEFDVVTGNGVATNKKYKSTLEYNGIAKKIIQFKIDGNMFILDTLLLDKLVEEGKLDTSKVNYNEEIVIGVSDKGKPITMSTNESFVDKIFSFMPPEYVDSIMKVGRKYNGGKLLMYTETKPLQKRVPLILILMYFEGFASVMKKAGIEYEIIPKTDEPLDVDLFEYGITEMSDGYIKWKRYPTENSLLMNGLNPLPMHLYSTEDLESKDTYTYLLTNIYSYANQSFNLDQYYDFMIDPITKEILTDMHLPTDLVSLCLLANKMLKTDDATPESDLRNMRLRSNEIIAYHTYKAITEAYNAYRKTQHRRNPTPISVKQDAVIRGLLGKEASAMNDASSLNPVLEISKLRAVTYKGENGTNEDHAFKLNVRAYNETMLGVLGITTSPDSGVGINRQLTLEPNITSTRGYIDVAGKENVEELNSAQLLSPSELLTPLGVQHDDPTRTSMAYKQTMYMVLVDNSDPVLIGNGAEKILPYHLSSDFVVNAEDDGEVVEKTEDFLVVRYKNGKFRSIDLSKQFKKNAAAGFYIESSLITNLNPGDKFTKNTILAWDDKAFRKKGNNPDVAMRLGPLVKVAIIPEWDIYEDSAPVTHKASEKMATTMVMPVTVALDKNAYVSKMVKVGDQVNAGDNVIVFDNYHDDPDVMELIRTMREGLSEEIIETHSTTKTTHYTGTVSGIDVVTTVPLDELSESLQKIVKAHWKKIKRKEAILTKYENDGDLKYYKSGNAITTCAEPVKADYQGKVKGTKVDEGVLITFYISFKDILSRGDKLSAEFALKSTTSHVIDEGLEPYSEFRPDETIDLITAPLSISARKTPSIFIAMFGNKILIEAKRHLKDYWNNN
jgi:hypothetical protein